MKNVYRAGWLCASVLALAACGGGEQKAATNTANAAAPAAPAEPAQNAAGGGSASGEEGGATAGARQDFTLVNNTGHTVMTLNVSPSNSDEWGPDILGRDVLPNGESAQITFERAGDQCEWDIRATYDDGDTTDARGANLCELATVTLTGE